MTVLTFGRIVDICGAGVLDVAPQPDTDSLEAHLHGRYPELKGLTYVLAVDQKTITGNTPLHPSSVVAVLPPFSGG
ncbi:MAG TPA: MoaD/ThiS family protein [Dinghuibacter sp.]|jgi:molybdopterin converting factor small subunit|uniref:MoaD/ThiS family protein n=1 Tax=Dinghuibacter sp. TaxID=2024697 RepID=UPI002C54B0D6|nr:MoaD/ThiS family protein [Dinghuibacter sp.]HTJ10605.1 MoaD/ThiS family protein [Dinghuibacter sp.]